MQFARFVQRCNKSWSSRTRKAIVKSKKGQPASVSKAVQDPVIEPMPCDTCRPGSILAGSCLTNPDIEVRHQRAELWQDDRAGAQFWRWAMPLWTNLISLNMLLQRGLPPKLLTANSPCTDIYTSRRRREHELFDSRINNCPNFRFFPQDDFLDEAQFRAGVLRLSSLQVLIFLYLQDGLETCIEELNSIFREG
ncbi:hypothetical protein T440DRAFT_542935, partial [Plenodomus tracheiphilus IPT5]